MATGRTEPRLITDMLPWAVRSRAVFSSRRRHRAVEHLEDARVGALRHVEAQEPPCSTASSSLSVTLAYRLDICTSS
jgi:hypothetical protein